MYKKILPVLWISCLLCFYTTHAQGIEQKLAAKMRALVAGSQMQHGIAGLCVADVSTGKIVYSYNSNIGLVPASNMKVFTAIMALQTLGDTFTYKTEIGYKGSIEDSMLKGTLIIKGYGDPTLGSWRYQHTQPDSVMANIAGILRKAGIRKIDGNVFLDGSAFSFNPIPGGWTWEDMGSYYGAGCWGLNWHENQYDMQLKPGRHTGDSVEIKSTDPEVEYTGFVNELQTAGSGTGDNSYIYLPPYSETAVVEGTIPAGGTFTVSGSLPEPFTPFATALKKLLADSGFTHKGQVETSTGYALLNRAVPHYDSSAGTIYSPRLDSIVYWFLKKSINMYGEALLKTIALTKSGYGSTAEGAGMMRRFYQGIGIDSDAIKMYDGSGLSAKDHVTTAALVQALLFARKQRWFASFYNGLPVYNNMHMKSGTISAVKSFSGYHKAANGREYAFSLIINNYDGGVNGILDKMYTVLDVLK